MPVGILVLKWDNEIGPVLIATYPESLDPPKNLQTQIYSAHRYSSLEPGFGKLTLKNNKMASVYTGAVGLLMVYIIYRLIYSKQVKILSES